MGCVIDHPMCGGCEYCSLKCLSAVLREVGAAINAAIVHEAGIYSARQSFYSKALINPKHIINFWVIMADEHEQFEEPQPYDAAA